MEKEKLESLLIDYIDGNLTEADRAVVEKELQHENTAKLYNQLKEVMALMDNVKTKIPRLSLKQNFEKALQYGRQAGFLSALDIARGRGGGFSDRGGGYWRPD